MTERWSTKSKACSAHGPKTNFNLQDKVGGNSRPINWFLPPSFKVCKWVNIRLGWFDCFSPIDFKLQMNWNGQMKNNMLCYKVASSIDREYCDGSVVVNLLQIYMKSTSHHNMQPLLVTTSVALFMGHWNLEIFGQCKNVTLFCSNQQFLVL